MRLVAHATVIDRTLPCHVQVLSSAGTGVVKLELAKPGWAYDEEIGADAAVASSPVADANTIASADPVSKVVWLRYAEDQEPPDLFIDRSIDHTLGADVQAEHERIEGLLAQAFDSVGFRPLEVTRAEGRPDPRIKAIARWHGTSLRSPDADELVEDIRAGVRLLVVVPEAAAATMTTASLLYTHGWTRWEFFTVAEHYALLALEASVRELYVATLPEVVRIEADRGSDRKIVETKRQWDTIQKTVRQLQKDGFSRPKIDGSSVPASADNALAVAARLELVTAWERERISQLLWFRNYFAHPKGPHLSWIGVAREHMYEAAFLINISWARQQGVLPAGAGLAESRVRRT